MYPFLQTLFADAGYQGRQFHSALKKNLASPANADRQALGSGQGIRGAAQALARWRGSTAAADSPRIGRTSIAQRSRFCASPQFGSCSENFVILTDVSGQTLRLRPIGKSSECLRLTVRVKSGKAQTEQKISASSREQTFAAVF